MSDIYILINSKTGEIVAHTIIYFTDVKTSEILDCRIYDAIESGIVPDDEYTWEKSDRKFGVLI